MKRERWVLPILLGVTVLWAAMMLRFRESDLYWVLGCYALFVLVSLAVLLRRELRAQLRVNGSSILVGAAVGVAMTLCTYPVYNLAAELLPAIEPAVQSLYRSSRQESLLTALAWVFVILTAEELLFRGAWLVTLERRVGRFPAAAASVGLYAASQTFTGSVIVGLLALCCGAIWTAERNLTGSLVAPLVSHAVWTPIVIVLYPVT